MSNLETLQLYHSPEHYYIQAITLLLKIQSDKVRKGDGTLYFGHLTRVAGLVFEGGGNYFDATVALLHDFIEDTPDGEVIIRSWLPEEDYTDILISCILECSDVKLDATSIKPDWRIRKEKHIAKLSTVSNAAFRVLLADKIDNISSFIRLYEESEDCMDKFNSTIDDQLWYFSSCINEFVKRRRSSNLDYQIGSFGDLIGKLELLVDKK